MFEVLPQFLINVIIPAMLYAIPAVGYTVVLSVTRIDQLAVGGMMMAAGYTFYSARLAGLPWAAAIALAIACAAALGWLSSALVFERFQGKRRVRVGAALIGVLSILLLLENALLMAFGPSSKSLAHPWGTHRTIAGGIITDIELIIVIVALMSGVAVWWFLHRTRRGRALRAIADNAEVAAVVGIDVRRGRHNCWTLSGLLAGIAGVLYTLEYNLIPAQATTNSIRAFFRAAVGGIGSVGGAFASSALLEAVEQGMVLWVSSAFKFVAVAVVFILALWWRPQGLFGRK